MHAHSPSLPSHNRIYFVMGQIFSLCQHFPERKRSRLENESHGCVILSPAPEVNCKQPNGSTVFFGDLRAGPLVPTFRRAGWHWLRLQRGSHSILLCSLNRNILKGLLTIGITSIKNILTSSPWKDNFLACAAPVL